MADEAKDELIDFPDYPPLDETGMVDLWQIVANLALTPAERIQRLQGFLELYDAMRQAGKKYYAALSSTHSQTA